MYFVYVLRSTRRNRFYIGHTASMSHRLKEHNLGRVRATRYGLPWKTVYTAAFRTRSEAYRRELEIKSYKSGIKFKKLLGLWKDK